jgi:hypothetical protein
MRATDIIRNVLDLIDQVEEKSKEDGISGEIEVQRVGGDDDVGRFRQIFDLLSKGDEPAIANAPNEKYANVDSVTTLAGGGVNGPKHPADIRVKDPRGFE